MDKGDVLLAMIGTIGNPVIVDTDRPFSIKNVALLKYYGRGVSNPGFTACRKRSLSELQHHGLRLDDVGPILNPT